MLLLVNPWLGTVTKTARRSEEILFWGERYIIVS